MREMSTSKKSIIIDDLTMCFVCGRPAEGTHHILYGSANRRLADKYKLVVGLCYAHHRGNNGVHGGNKELDIMLKQLAQRRFIEEYKDSDFIAIFGRNYL